MTGTRSYHCILLAGDRGADDPVARVCGVARKALAPIGGQAMIARVLAALAETPQIGSVTIVANHVDEISAELEVMAPGQSVSFLEGGTSPASSVLVALGHEDVNYPVLVITADNPLLTSVRLTRFLELAENEAGDADIVAGLARKSDIQAAYPGMRRTFINLSDDGYSGCNLFLLQREAAGKAVQFWTGLEANRKKALSLIAAFGFGTLLRALTGRLSLADALARASNVIDARIGAVILDPEASIDVDREDHIPVVEAILKRRANGD